MSFTTSTLSSLQDFGKQDKLVVVITGSSSGIGKYTALELSKHPKYKVYATMRSPNKWIPSDADNAIRILPLDVTNQESVDSCIEKVIDIEGKIDVLINNAGYGIAGCVESTKVEEAMSLFDVNVWGVVRTLQAVLPHMRRRRGGYIINISSTAGIRGVPGLEFYSSSKFALEGFTDAMRYGLAAYNISVTNINAGPVKTSIMDNINNSGLGSRKIPDSNDNGFLDSITNSFIANLASRIESGQSAEDFGKLIHDIINLKLSANHITDVPFNMGNDISAQNLLQDIRKNPSGWEGEVYTKIYSSIPPLSQVTKTNDFEINMDVGLEKDEL